jgi:hypothetical protein
LREQNIGERSEVNVCFEYFKKTFENSNFFDNNLVVKIEDQEQLMIFSRLILSTMKIVLRMKKDLS